MIAERVSERQRVRWLEDEMAWLPHNLKCTLAAFMALLQCLTLPVTVGLHIGCEHTHISQHAEQLLSCEFGCSGCEYASGSTAGSVPEAPHDSDSCCVCQSAYAVTTVEFESPQQLWVELVTSMSDWRTTAPDSAPCSHWFGRGPPVCS